nr:hypothetical protein [Pandoravirus massiliensis]
MRHVCCRHFLSRQNNRPQTLFGRLLDFLCFASFESSLAVGLFFFIFGMARVRSEGTDQEKTASANLGEFSRDFFIFFFFLDFVSTGQRWAAGSAHHPKTESTSR